jgi:hypothetical protein
MNATATEARQFFLSSGEDERIRGEAAPVGCRSVAVLKHGGPNSPLGAHAASRGFFQTMPLNAEAKRPGASALP